MKKIIIIFMTLVSLFSLISCTPNDLTKSDDDQINEEEKHQETFVTIDKKSILLSKYAH